ncbi:hypothetical protein BH24ACT5_BH24ACT5_14270 [soil metagenome]
MASLGGMTRTISQAELRNGSAGVMDALEAGEDFVITRHGAAVGELRPIRRSRRITAADLVAAFATLPDGTPSEQIRAEVDRVLGEDRIGDD